MILGGNSTLNKYKFYVLICVLLTVLAPLAVVESIMIMTPSLETTDEGLATVLFAGLITFIICIKGTFGILMKIEINKKTEL